MAVAPLPKSQPKPLVVRAPQTLAPRPVAPAVKPVQVAAPAKPAQAPAEPGFFKRILDGAIAGLLGGTHTLLTKSPWLNQAIGNISGPIVKRKFNTPAGANDDPGPAQLKPETIEQARQLMAERFKPKEGKVLVAISGGGDETVHCFVVSEVKPNGQVMITQALAQSIGPAEDYSGFGGMIRKFMDKKMGNQPNQMQGVVNESWTDYAVRSHRNSIVVMEMEADPAKIEEALKELKTLVGKPYDKAMLAADPATKSTKAAMYCTEVSSWFINKLRPGTVKQSYVKGFPIFQVADHMRATTDHGGPLKVLFNGQNRLDVKAVDPFPKDR